MKRLHRSGWTLPIVPLIESAFSLDEAAFNAQMKSIRDAQIHFDCRRTYQELDSASISAPILNDELLRLCVTGMLCRDVDLSETKRSLGRSY
jgi:hypothetical protein